MENKKNIELIKELQKVTKQMVEDDIEENPEAEYEYFDCDCCGKSQILAGSIQYGQYRLCNDCVLLAEYGFETKSIKNIDDLIKAMEEKRLAELCEFIKEEEKRMEN